MEIENKIVQKLNDLGVNPANKGFRFLVTAIDMAIEDPECLDHLTKGLYPYVGEVHKSTASRVERAIRHSKELIGVEITNGEFIAKLANEIKYGL